MSMRAISLGQVLFLLAHVAAKSFLVISLASNPNFVLTMTDAAVGFADRTKIPHDERIMAELGPGNIKIGTKYLCKSTDSDVATLCVTSHALHGSFTHLKRDGRSVLMQNRNLVLARGEFNMSTDMYDVVVKNVGILDTSDYYLNIDSYDNENIVLPKSESLAD